LKFLLSHRSSFYEIIGNYSRITSLHIIAVLVRGVIGVALLSCATTSKFPVIFQVIGWASRMSGVLALLFGGFLFYGVV